MNWQSTRIYKFWFALVGLLEKVSVTPKVSLQAFFQAMLSVACTINSTFFQNILILLKKTCHAVCSTFLSGCSDQYFVQALWKRLYAQACHLPNLVLLSWFASVWGKSILVIFCLDNNQNVIYPKETVQHSLIAFYLCSFANSFTSLKSGDIVHRSYFLCVLWQQNKHFDLSVGSTGCSWLNFISFAAWDLFISMLVSCSSVVDILLACAAILYIRK